MIDPQKRRITCGFEKECYTIQMWADEGYPEVGSFGPMAVSQ